MRIGIDIDDTLTEIKEQLDKSAYEYAKKLGKNNITIKEILEDKSNDENEYQKKYNFSFDELKIFLGPIQEEITNNAKPRQNVVEIIEKLKQDGNEIYIITAHDAMFRDDPYIQSKNWLDKHGIIYDKIIVNAGNKSEIFIKEKIDLYIGNQLKNCLSILNSGVPVIRISKEEKSVVTFTNWKDIYNYITNNKIVKIIRYNNSYSEQISQFINESMNIFINRPYKIRKDIIHIEDYYLKNGGCFWCAVDIKTDKIIGTIAFEKQNDIGILKRFYVSGDYQNLGIGLRLYKMLEDHIINNTDIKTLYLACGRVLEKAHKFYLKNGWKQIEKLPIEMHVADDDDFFKKNINR